LLDQQGAYQWGAGDVDGPSELLDLDPLKRRRIDDPFRPHRQVRYGVAWDQLCGSRESVGDERGSQLWVIAPHDVQRGPKAVGVHATLGTQVQGGHGSISIGVAVGQRV